MNPRPYQFAIEDALEKGWAEAMRQLVISTMGSGKTICFAQLCLKFVKAGIKVLILVDQDELVRQAVSKIESTTGLKCEIEKAEYRASKSAPVVVASVQSMCRRLDNWPQNHFGLIIADEADKSLAATWQRCLKHFNTKVAGFTATPIRADGKNMGDFYERIAFEAYFFDFIGNGKWAFDLVNGQRVQKNWVAPISVQMLPIKIDVSGFGKGKGKDFSDAEADEIISPHLTEIAKAIQHYAPFRRTLLFLPLIKTCQRFAEIAGEIGLSADFVSGVDAEREDKLRRFKAWDFDVLANSMLLSRGVDIPEIDALMVARPTKSVSLYQQFVGRGTRICDGKENLLLLDPLYVSDKHMICRPANLIALNEEDAENIAAECEGAGFLPGEVAEQCELDLMMSAASAREKALMRELEKHKEAKSKLYSLTDLAISQNNYELAHFEAVTPNEKRPVAAPQLKWLNKIKVSPDGKFFIYGGAPQGSKPLDVASIANEGHASRVLEVAFNKQNQGIAKASYEQMKKMASMGYPGAWQATHGEAVKFFAGLRS